MPKRHPRVKLKKVDEGEVSWAAFIPTFGLRDRRTRGDPVLCMALNQNKSLLAVKAEREFAFAISDQFQKSKRVRIGPVSRVQTATDCHVRASVVASSVLKFLYLMF